MMELVLAAVVGFGLSLVAIGILLRAQERDQSLAEILDLPFGERDVPIEAVTESRSPFADSMSSIVGRVVEQFDAKGALVHTLERARIPLKAGEYVVVVICGMVVAGVVLGLVTGSAAFGVLGLAVAAMVGKMVPKVLIRRRKRAFEAQLPGSLSLIAASLAAGHTFLRSIQMMCEESEPPLAEEFERVVYETRLGDPLVDSLDRMAARLEIRDLIWVVQAIRIQQTAGGKLSDLLHTLADFIRAREEVRREISVLTAEGRISAWILGALPVGLAVAIQTSSPGYMDPLLQGKGLFVLAATITSVAIGVGLIFKMVKIEV